MTIVVDPYLSLYEAHQICDKVEIHLHSKGISSVYVHPEPYTTKRRSKIKYISSQSLPDH